MRKDKTPLDKRYFVVRADIYRGYLQPNMPKIRKGFGHGEKIEEKYIYTAKELQRILLAPTYLKRIATCKVGTEVSNYYTTVLRVSEETAMTIMGYEENMTKATEKKKNLWAEIKKRCMGLFSEKKLAESNHHC
jgi:hypothetical protein